MLLFSYHTEKKDVTHQDHSLGTGDKTMRNADLAPAGWQQQTGFGGREIYAIKKALKDLLPHWLCFYQNKKAQMDSKPTENMDHNLISGYFSFCVQLTSAIHGAPLQKKKKRKKKYKQNKNIFLETSHAATAVKVKSYMDVFNWPCYTMSTYAWQKWTAQVSTHWDGNKCNAVILQDISKGSFQIE